MMEWNNTRCWNYIVSQYRRTARFIVANGIIGRTLLLLMVTIVVAANVEALAQAGC
jgi:hypothetical protein